MRPDLAKCVIEAPRRGSFARGNKVREYGKLVKCEDGIEYEGLTRIPSSRHDRVRGEGKSLSDKLGPLHGYLRANCGRPWDDVYSEIAYHIGRFTKQEGLRHIIDAHLDVAENVWIGTDDRIYSDGKRGPELVGRYSWRGAFYVEPVTGILREAPDYKRAPEAPKPVEAVDLGNNCAYQKWDGIWYYTEIRKETKTVPRYSKHYKKVDGKYDWVAVYIGTEEKVVDIIIVKRQLGKKELKKLAEIIAGRSGPTVFARRPNKHRKG